MRDLVPRKELSNRLRRVSPALVELARVRHVRLDGFTSEYVAELASIPRYRRLLAEARAGRDVCWLEGEQPEPLVTIRIATRDRPELLMERSLASALRQTYERIEVLVVGDGCDDRTARAIEQLRDPRVRYVNLPVPGRYPVEPTRRWRVAGTKPMNAALDLSAGAWIAPCDDDDEFTDDHVETLLGAAKASRSEFVWSKSLYYSAESPETGVEVGQPQFGRGATTHGAIMYSLGLDFIRYSPTSDRMREPADWNLFRRMRLSGVRMEFADVVSYRYWEAGVAQYRSPTD